MTIDRRIQKTTANIENVFMKLLQKKDISKITIKNLCDEALISKSTFYDHYSDKYALADTIINQYANQFQNQIHQRFLSITERNSLEVISKITQEIALENQNVATILSISTLHGSLEQRLKTILLNEAQNYFNEHHTYQKFDADFLATMYSELAFASISFTIKNYSKDGFIDQQNRFVILLQEFLIQHF
ncbi:TetR/AcrR family transcriptional regulator [Convivina intestini]|uniref:TetR/AcrR family transcriptional regulator n=1 Tax=Convivina intestini TaxID=1505726 RepID=UPI00200D98C5|nr:TetR/AcrR family transcriptional regulator [Convivina intestini]CAH1851865.1 hypothetical protein R078131_00361 [Convivina intestini]